MAVPDELGEHIRQRFDYRCAYCGVHERDVGSELEVEHFHPRSKGGSDDIDNLIYSCSACNRFKANYWPTADAPHHLHLLHPLHDDHQTHVDLLDDGRLTGLTKRGRFHIEILHLNRPQLVILRLRRIQQKQLQQQLQQLYLSQISYQERIKQLEAEVMHLQVEIMRLRWSSSD